MTGSRAREAAARFAERRKREDEAPRLSSVVPNLATLRLAVEERRPAIQTPETKHVRVVVVDRAPALFLVPCGDPACEGGGYDLTHPILSELRAGRPEFTIDDECYGHAGGGRCGRLLRAVGTASYR